MKLITPEEYKVLTPRQQGYVTYMQAEHDGSRIPKKCPYKIGSDECKQWGVGEFAGILEAQDCDD